MRKKSPYKKLEKQKCIIFVEGKSELMYFNAIRQLEEFKSKYAITIQDCGGQDKLLDIAIREKDKSKLRGYDRHIFVLDRDTISKNDFDLLLKRHDDTNIAFSNPKFELWILAHYEKLNITNSDIDNRLKRELPEYKKGDNKISDLASGYERAINNSKLLENLDFNEQCLSIGKIIKTLK